ncbi:c-type cytochrome biogenesis protein CcmI [uncultured Microbulbifer sp.]|uniref:c-type cytochrome biogenesis protein CcmI n=1 Tax=uncultured Microbulbifer sp. TaxID=348147 RepID=UPI0025CD7011|nr:c-type cytochrome biogenesis protein CcmI [uncultured Microbulbifer sp.]
MTELWGMLALLILPLAAFIAWPLLRRRRGAGDDHLDGADADRTRRALYLEHKAELDAARANGAIGDSEYQSMHTELARKFLQEEGSAFRLAGIREGGRGLIVAMALLVPACAVGLYFYWGAHRELALYRDMVASQSGTADTAAEASITRRLRERTHTHPEDLSSRYVLAQRLLVGNDIEGAVAQYRYIVEREPNAVNIRAELAQALFFAGGSRITPEVTREVTAVLETQPSNPTALGLAGIAAFESGQFRQARDYWQGALSQMAPGSNAYQALAAGVARAEKALAEAGDGSEEAETSLAAAQQSPAAAAGENSIRIKVSLAESVSANPDTPVFVYARTAESPMPLAIVRLKAADLPTEVVLDESRAMMPGRSLKTVDSVQLVARLAVSGNARPAPGDWQGGVKALSRSDWDQPVSIAIDEKI